MARRSATVCASARYVSAALSPIFAGSSFSVHWKWRTSDSLIASTSEANSVPEVAVAIVRDCMRADIARALRTVVRSDDPRMERRAAIDTVGATAGARCIAEDIMLWKIRGGGTRWGAHQTMLRLGVLLLRAVLLAATLLAAGAQQTSYEHREVSTVTITVDGRLRERLRAALREEVRPACVVLRYICCRARVVLLQAVPSPNDAAQQEAPDTDTDESDVPLPPGATLTRYSICPSLYPFYDSC